MVLATASMEPPLLHVIGIGCTHSLRDLVALHAIQLGQEVRCRGKTEQFGDE